MPHVRPSNGSDIDRLQAMDFHGSHFFHYCGINKLIAVATLENRILGGPYEYMHCSTMPQTAFADLFLMAPFMANRL